MQGPNRDAVTLAEGTEQEPTKLADLHPGDTTHPKGSWVDFTVDEPERAQQGAAPDYADAVRPDRVVTQVPGGYVYWGAGKFRPTALPEKWHVTADGSVDAGE